MALTDVRIRAAKAGDKPFRLPDTGGLFPYITPAGGKSWRMRYKLAGVEKTLTFGPYPEVTLSGARDASDAARAVLRQGKDPAVQKRVQRAQEAVQRADTFEAIAREWHEVQSAVRSPDHAEQALASFGAKVFPIIGDLPLAEITPPVLLAVVRPIEKRGTGETAIGGCTCCCAARGMW